MITLGQPVARTVAMFTRRGFRCFGLGRTPLKGNGGLDGMLKRLGRKEESVEAVTAGLPGFAFLTSLRDAESGADLLPELVALAQEGELGRLPKRWLDWYGALAVGDATDHAEFLPAQPDFIPEEDPAFGETVEQRKERILYMNTVGEKGAFDREGMMAQLLLLSKAPPDSPVRLALALLRGESVTLPAVARLNEGALPQLPRGAVIEAPLTLSAGQIVPSRLLLPEPLAEICGDIDAGEPAGGAGPRRATGARCGSVSKSTRRWTGWIGCTARSWWRS